MLCKNALVKKVQVLSPDQMVGDALQILKKAGIRHAPVLGEGGTLEGIFSVTRVLENSLPVSLASGTGVPVTIPSAPGMSVRLRRITNDIVAHVMNRQVRAVHPDTPIETSVRLLAEGGPVPVLDRESGEFLGLVTDESVLAALEKG